MINKEGKNGKKPLHHLEIEDENLSESSSSTDLNEGTPSPTNRSEGEEQSISEEEKKFLLKIEQKRAFKEVEKLALEKGRVCKQEPEKLEDENNSIFTSSSDYTDKHKGVPSLTNRSSDIIFLNPSDNSNNTKYGDARQLYKGNFGETTLKKINRGGSIEAYKQKAQESEVGDVRRSRGVSVDTSKRNASRSVLQEEQECEKHSTIADSGYERPRFKFGTKATHFPNDMNNRSDCGI